jgi:purine-binding chemotaxis protein CheW
MAEAAQAIAPSRATRHFLTFHVGKVHYALAAEGIAEVVRIPAIARIPQAPSGLMGVANLRGDVVPVADVGRLLGRDRALGDTVSRAIVMRGEATVALAVDSVGELVEVAEDKIETRQAVLAALPGEQLEGAFRPRADADFVKIVNLETLLAQAFVPAKRTERQFRRDSLAQPHQDLESGNLRETKFMAFRVGGQDYALPLEAVQEISGLPDTIAAMPHSEALVLGVTAFRDALLPLISLGGLLGLTAAPDQGNLSKIIVVAVKGGLVGLVADRMTAIFAADESLIDPLPEILAARAKGESRVKAIYRGGDRLISILSPDLLFGEAVMQKLGGMREPAIQPSKQTTATERGMQLLVFRLGDEEYGLPIEAVEEVARVPEQIARIPKAPKFLEGVINLRGEVLPVVDQRKRFNLPAPDQVTARRLIVVRTKQHKAALIVDSVSEVLRSTRDAVQPAPDLAGEPAKLVAGVINLEREGRIILLLGPGELLTRAERGLLDAFAKSKPEITSG